MSSPTLLIFGARKKSIGDGVRKMWSDMFDGHVVTAGLSGDEDIDGMAADEDWVRETIAKVEPTRILVTIGVNQPRGDGDLYSWLSTAFETNVSLPMSILETWVDMDPPKGGHFVVMSSNSAHIPRSQSMAYCASKAALSMAVRCAARDIQRANMDLVVYGWEPGLVKGTPMSAERAGTRMLGLPEGIGRRALAHQIVSALAFGGAEYNGVLVRLDNGEV